MSRPHPSIVDTALVLPSQRYSRSWPLSSSFLPSSWPCPHSGNTTGVTGHILVLPAVRPFPPRNTAGRGWQMFSSVTSPWLDILILPMSRQVVDDHPCPPGITGYRGRLSLSFQCHRRSWSSILILSASRPCPPGVMAGCCRHSRSLSVMASSSSKRRDLVLPALRQVLVGHPRHPSVAASTTPFAWRHQRGQSCKIYSRRRLW